MSLTDTALKNAKPRDKPYKLSDRNGLYILISKTGARLWRYKYRIDGSERVFSMGEYPEITLAKAREAHSKARELVKQGIHPLQQRKQQELEKFSEAGNTFYSIASDWITQNRTSWSGYYLRQIERAMAVDVFPKIGSLPIKQVKAAHVLSIIKDVEKRGAPTVAILIRQWCSAIFCHAVANLKAEFDPVSAIKGAVKRPKVQHSKPLQAQDIPAFMIALRSFGGYRTTSIAIELLLLTFVRTAELRKAEWHEFDLDNAMWRIPAHKMKMKAEHIVPLASQAVALLRELKEWTGNRTLLFPNLRTPSQGMSATTINRALERMGYAGRFSAHGFRSTASTILHERGYRPEIIERQLAHAEQNKVKAAYNHAEYLQERKAMMQDWAYQIYSVCQITN